MVWDFEWQISLRKGQIAAYMFDSRLRYGLLFKNHGTLSCKEENQVQAGSWTAVQWSLIVKLKLEGLEACRFISRYKLVKWQNIYLLEEKWKNGCKHFWVLFDLAVYTWLVLEMKSEPCMYFSVEYRKIVLWAKWGKPFVIYIFKVRNMMKQRVEGKSDRSSMANNDFKKPEVCILLTMLCCTE